jgi:hypothetical protein
MLGTKTEFYHVPQKGDGNCLFHSLAYFFNGGMNANEARQTVCNFMERCFDMSIKEVTIRDWVEMHSEPKTSFSNYVAKMRRSGEWGGSVELMCFALEKNVNIAVYRKINESYKMIVMFSSGVDGADTISLLHSNNNHYDSLVVVGGN